MGDWMVWKLAEQMVINEVKKKVWEKAKKSAATVALMLAQRLEQWKV